MRVRAAFPSRPERPHYRSLGSELGPAYNPMRSHPIWDTDLSCDITCLSLGHDRGVRKHPAFEACILSWYQLNRRRITEGVGRRAGRPFSFGVFALNVETLNVQRFTDDIGTYNGRREHAPLRQSHLVPLTPSIGAERLHAPLPLAPSPAHSGHLCQSEADEPPFLNRKFLTCKRPAPAATAFDLRRVRRYSTTLYTRPLIPIRE